MRFDEGLNITEAQAEAFYIVQVAGVGAVEFFEDAALGLLAHADAIVFDANDQVLLGAMGNDADQEVFF